MTQDPYRIIKCVTLNYSILHAHHYYCITMEDWVWSDWQGFCVLCPNVSIPIRLQEQVFGVNKHFSSWTEATRVENIPCSPIFSQELLTPLETVFLHARQIYNHKRRNSLVNDPESKDRSQNLGAPIRLLYCQLGDVFLHVTYIVCVIDYLWL